MKERKNKFKTTDGMGLRRQFFSCTRSAIVNLELRTREYGNVFVAKKREEA